MKQNSIKGKYRSVKMAVDFTRYAEELKKYYALEAEVDNILQYLGNNYKSNSDKEMINTLSEYIQRKRVYIKKVEDRFQSVTGYPSNVYFF